MPAHETNIWGDTDVDTFQFGDDTGVNDCADRRPDDDGRRGCATPSSDGYIFLGSKTIVHGSQTLDLRRATTARTSSSSGTCSR